MISGELVAREPLATDHGRVRVLHVHSGNLHGGVETFLRTVAQHRSDAPSPVTMDYALCFDGRIAGELRAAGATVHLLGEVRVRSPRQIAAARRELARVLRAQRYEVVVCHSVWTHGLFAGVALEQGARLAHYMHDLPNPKGWADRWASLTQPDLVLCNSAFVEDAGRWLFPRAKRRMIRYPVAVGGSGASRDAVRAALGTASDSIVILQASRMQAWKGQRLLIDALSRLRANERWSCWIAGGPQRPSEDAYYRELVSSVERMGLASRIRFLNQRGDVAALMNAADIYCQPNVGPEPFGLAFVEALSAGLPIVTTAMGGPLEIVSPDCGSLTLPSAEAVAAALEAYVDDDAKRKVAADAGPLRARALCDVDVRTREFAGELAALAKQGGSTDAGERALLSKGRSNDAILSVVTAALREKAGHVEKVVDLGCGAGDCARALEGMYEQYVGCDVVRYDNFPRAQTIQFKHVDLNEPPYPVESASASVVVSVETIEHIENPRALVREMARIARPGGWIVATTPNQLSLMSKLYLVGRNQFHAFQDAPGLYPAHITALLEQDLIRIARECGLVDVEIRYTNSGRIPLTPWHWPRRMGAGGQWFSDNVVMLARRS